MEQVIERTLGIINEVSKKNVKPGDSLLDAKIDSISMIHILVQIEKEFNIDLEDENLIFTRYQFVEDIINMVSENTKTA